MTSRKYLLLVVLVLGLSLFESCFIFELDCDDEYWEKRFTYSTATLDCLTCGAGKQDTVSLLLTPDYEWLSGNYSKGLGFSAFATSCYEPYIADFDIVRLDVFLIRNGGADSLINSSISIDYWDRDGNMQTKQLKQGDLPQFGDNMTLNIVRRPQNQTHQYSVKILLELEDGNTVTSISAMVDNWID